MKESQLINIGYHRKNKDEIIIEGDYVQPLRGGGFELAELLIGMTVKESDRIVYTKNEN